MKRVSLGLPYPAGDFFVLTCKRGWDTGKHTRDCDEKGNMIPGARIKYEYDLCAKGLAWDKDVREKPAFVSMISEIRGLFKDL